MININANTLVDVTELEKDYMKLKEKHKKLSKQFDECNKKINRYKQLLSEKDKEIRLLNRKIKNIKKETLYEVIQMIDEGKFGLIEER